VFGSHTTSTEIIGSLASFAIVDHTRSRFCTKFASSLYVIVGESAGQQIINMKYVTNNICKTRHCGHYLMETKTKDN